MAQQILSHADGLANLARADRQTLRSSGASDSRASIILATGEMVRRLARGKIRRKLMNQPAAVATYVSLRFSNEEQEVMGALYLDIRNRLIGERDVFRGCLTHASVEPAPILQEALRHRAAGFILWHSHPSGDPTPSIEDLAFTRRMAEAGELLGIRLLDHLILGSGGLWISLCNQGAW